jgi:hypothetical protein
MKKKKSDKVDELLNAQRSGGSQKVLKPDQLDYIQFLYFLLLYKSSPQTSWKKGGGKKIKKGLKK